MMAVSDKVNYAVNEDFMLSACKRSVQINL